MKSIKDYEKWMAAASELLTPTQLKVFVTWYGDSAEFSAGASMLSERLFGVDKSNIRRALNALEELRFIKDSGKKWRNTQGSPTTIYILGHLDDVISSALLKRVTKTNKHVNICDKCVSSYPKVCSCNDESVLAATHVNRKLEEQVETSTSHPCSLSSIKEPKENDNFSKPNHEYDPTVPMVEFQEKAKNLDELFLTKTKHLPSIGSNNNSFEAFAESISNEIDDLTIPAFNAWGDSCYIYGPSRTVVTQVIEKALNDRFKDKTGLWAVDGPIAQKAKERVSAIVESRLASINKNTLKRSYPCSPEKWKIYQKTAKVNAAKEKVYSDEEFLRLIATDEEKQLAEIEISNEDQAIFQEVQTLVIEHQNKIKDRFL